mgnify:CR=1 FL=1
MRPAGRSWQRFSPRSDFLSRRSSSVHGAAFCLSLFPAFPFFKCRSFILQIFPLFMKILPPFHKFLFFFQKITAKFEILFSEFHKYFTDFHLFLKFHGFFAKFSVYFANFSEILKNRNPIFEISFFYQIRSALGKQKRRPRIFRKRRFMQAEQITGLFQFFSAVTYR